MQRQQNKRGGSTKPETLSKFQKRINNKPDGALSPLIDISANNNFAGRVDQKQDNTTRGVAVVG